MPKCPKCGTSVETPGKSWKLKSRSSRRTIQLGIFHCPKCNKKFRKKAS